MTQKYIILIFWLGILGFAGGCSGPRSLGPMQIYPAPSVEAEWIRGGTPIEFEGELWFPADGTENLLDTEVYVVGEYKGVQIFVAKEDVRPYNRLYTKFGRNKFRYFEKKNDSN